MTFRSLALELTMVFAAVTTPAHTNAERSIDVRISDVTQLSEQKQIIKSLQPQLRSKIPDAKIKTCYPIVDYVQEMASGKDFSYGAYCKVETNNTTKNILMCDDWMVGKFTWIDSPLVNRWQIAGFIEANCPPGG